MKDIIKSHKFKKTTGQNPPYWNYYKCSVCGIHMATEKYTNGNTKGFKFNEKDIFDVMDNIPSCKEVLMDEALK